MIKLIDLLEYKNVGDLYHFTRYNISLLKILKCGCLKPSGARLEKLGHVSFSRNKNLWLYDTRIMIDGNKMSNKYKILPYSQLKPETEYDNEYDNESHGKHNQYNFEYESVIPSKLYGGKIDILPYIKRIDVMIGEREDKNYIWKNGIKIPHQSKDLYKEEILNICDKNNINIEFINKSHFTK